jgi:phosphoserine aminotransferase
MKIHNFSAGPCILPPSVMKKASEAVIEYNNSGLSLIEMSHRSKDFVAVMDRARALVKEVLNVPAHYEVLFLQGGASLGFYISAINYLKNEGKAAYINTGVWSTKAIEEAERLGKVEVIASSKDDNFRYIPKNYNIPTDADFFHFTSNNTIYGTQFQKLPTSPVPMICDMSSDIFSRPVNVSDYAMIYAGAQKNLGPAGATLYIVNPELLGKTGRNIPAMLDLKTQIKGESMYNTPPVFSVYVSMLMLEWLMELGGVTEMEKINRAKANLIYSEIDANPLFKGNTVVEDRSVMNATFDLINEGHRELFDQMWKKAGISGIPGHRSAGGYRASMYNALPLESVQALVDVMQDLKQKV